MSTYVAVVISPATTTRPVVIERLAGDAPVGSSREDGVEDRVGDLVGDLVRVPLGDRLRGEGEASRRHRRGTLARASPRAAALRRPGAIRRSAGGPSGRRRARAAAGPSSTAQTPSVIGSSIAEPARERRAAPAPSSGPRPPARSRARASSGVAPRAISSPARRLRPVGCQHVTIRSPMPARPENVSGSAPSASPSRAISTRPRVTSAAFALSPSPSPSTAPAASAITFFAAAQSSTPIRSSFT